MIDIAKNRTLSLLGSAVALSLALIVLFVACAIVAVVFPDLRFAHAWIGLFTVAPVNSPQAWLEGLFFSLALVGGAVTALKSIVTAPSMANARPSKVAPSLSVMEAAAITVPLKIEFVPNVADEPTCQKIFSGLAPPLRMTFLSGDVVSVVAI